MRCIRKVTFLNSRIEFRQKFTGEIYTRLALKNGVKWYLNGKIVEHFLNAYDEIHFMKVTNKFELFSDYLKLTSRKF